jgi:hypothetical protein
MRQVEPQALFNYYLIYTESFRLFVSDRVSLHLLLRYQTMFRLRDDVKHQAEELTTVQSRLRDCQTALSDAEVLHRTALYCAVLHCTELYCTVYFMYRLLSSFQYSLSTFVCFTPRDEFGSWRLFHHMLSPRASIEIERSI